MKNILGYFLFASLVLCLVNCTKHKVIPATPHTQTLQPGSDGQDTYVSKIDNLASDGNANLDNTNELAIGKVTAQATGTPATERAFVKFTGLSSIPSNATVTSAKLYLY